MIIESFEKFNLLSESFRETAVKFAVLQKMFNDKDVELSNQPDDEFDIMMSTTKELLDENYIKFVGTPYSSSISKETLSSLRNNKKLVFFEDFKKLADSGEWESLLSFRSLNRWRRTPFEHEMEARTNMLFNSDFFSLTKKGEKFMKDSKTQKAAQSYFGAKELGLLEGVEKKIEIKSEKYWRAVLSHDPYALKVLDTIMRSQKGFASERQMQVLDRARRGDKTPYHTKN
jgi:hypothetical protein